MIKSALESVENINRVIRQLQKVSSMQRNGQVIDAHRLLHKLISEMENNKRSIIEEGSCKENKSV